MEENFHIYIAARAPLKNCGGGGGGGRCLAGSIPLK